MYTVAKIKRVEVGFCRWGECDKLLRRKDFKTPREEFSPSGRRVTGY